MKKIFAVTAVFILICCAALGGLYAWHTLQPVVLPEPLALILGGSTLLPVSVDAVTETLGGYGSKELSLSFENAVDIGTLNISSVPLDFAEGDSVNAEGKLSFADSASKISLVKTKEAPMISITLTHSGSTLLDRVSPEKFEAFEFTENGEYEISATAGYSGQDADAAVYEYKARFALKPEPALFISSETAKQGDIVSLFLRPAFYDEEPVITTELGEPVFAPLEENCYFAAVPVWYAQEPGEYPVTVSLGDWQETLTVTVEEAQFGRQDLTMPQSTVDSTRGAANANEDYAKTIKPTYEIADRQKYWHGEFLRPVEGRITTQFGLFRYTNGSKTPTRHSGIDLAVPQGTPVPASNAGRVVYAGPVIISGNTVVIEHGGGLKTYYMHLSEINVKEGDMVEKGDVIGKVGTTGYSTGPHLHFEVKLGELSLDPWPLFDGTSGLFYFEGN